MPTLKGLKKQCKRITHKVNKFTPFKGDYYKLVRLPENEHYSYTIEYDDGYDYEFKNLQEVEAFLNGIEFAIDMYLTE